MRKNHLNCDTVVSASSEMETNIDTEVNLANKEPWSSHHHHSFKQSGKASWIPAKCLDLSSSGAPQRAP